MSRNGTLGLATLAFVYAPVAALADVTPEQVWDNWQAMSAASGYVMTAETQQRKGAALVLTGVQMRLEAEGGEALAQMGTIEMRELGDGRVEVLTAPSYPITMRSAETDESPFALRMRVNQTGMRTVVSGDPAAPLHDVTADSVRIVLEEAIAEDKAMPMTAEVVIERLAGRYTAAAEGAQAIEGGFDAGRLLMALTAQDPESPDGQLSFTYDSSDVTATFAGTLAGMDPQMDLPAMLAAGFGINYEFKQGPTRFDFDFADGQSTSRTQGTLGGAGLWMRLNADRIDYGTSAAGVDVTVSGSAIPFPEVKVAMQEYLLGLVLPMKPAAEPGDVGLIVRLMGLSVSDDIWAILDPDAVLPREPATLAVDVSGKLKVLKDLFSVETSISPDTAAEIQSLDIKQLQLAAAGAELTGSGALTFDNSDMTTYQGMPKPVGAIDLALRGGEALLDRLVQLGAVEAAQAAFAKQLAPMFTVPGSAPDTLTTRIEMLPDGSVTANGQQIQ